MDYHSVMHCPSMPRCNIRDGGLWYAVITKVDWVFGNAVKNEL